MVVNNRFIPNNVIKPVSTQPGNRVAVKNNNSPDFGEILQRKIIQNTELKFSKHAENRLRERNINLTAVQREKLSNAVNRAGEKGVNDTLVLVDDVAFVVNVRSKTVITAANSSDLKENVFTNIDGAVFT